MFRVIETETYQKEVLKWEKPYREAAEKLRYKLKESPFSGKPLGYRFLREKKIKEKRVYYFVYDDLALVLIVATSGKKDQQATIDHMKDKLHGFRELAEKITKQLPQIDPS
ncbi:MAG: hypothetical protein HY366_01865 [Candidatus Aenigmarchaeota archaeon]|nr:hypothetical protein [Candidatus Aenigmarchaeota archaeon]